LRGTKNLKIQKDNSKVSNKRLPPPRPKENLPTGGPRESVKINNLIIDNIPEKEEE